jgi:hypothetical protein
MSIIHDALKKVQQSMQKETAANPESAHVAPVEEVQRSAPSEKKPPYVLIISLCILTPLLLVWAAGGLVLPLMKQRFPQHIPAWLHKLSFLEKKVEAKPLAQIVIPPAAEPAPAPPSQEAKPAAASNEQASSNVPSQETAPATVPSTPMVLNVQGVMANSSQNVVLINNEIYEEGGVVNGYKIIKINLNAIVVEHDGQQETIPIKKAM